jgi:hypothetical protein
MMRQETSCVTKKITDEQFYALTRPLIGLPISRTWRGYGTAAFFEIGKLKEADYKRRDGTIPLWGQATIDLEIGWRVERLRSIYFGSSSGDRRISNCLNKLQGLTVVNISLEGRLPELITRLSNGVWLRSCCAWEGQPDWTIFFNNNPDNRQWTTMRNGKIILVTQETDK